MDTHTTHLGLTKREIERYSIIDLISAAARDDAGRLSFYSSISEAVAAKTGQQATTHRSYLIPSDVLVRDLTAGGGGSAGGFLVAGTQASPFGAALFATSVTARLPLRRVPMVGNAAVAVATTAPTVTWLATEATETSDAAMAFGQRNAVPKTVSAVQFISRQLDLQAPSSAAFVEQQLGAAVAKAIDVAFVNGSGINGQPMGLLGLSGTTSQSGSSLNYAGVTAMIKASEGYGGQPWVLMGVDAARLLRQRAKVTSGDPIYGNGTVDGLSSIVSRALPDDSMIVLDPSTINELRWGAVEVTVTPLASPTAFKAGAIGVRVMASVDWTVDHPATVAKAVSIT
ncbi:MAG: phage major capsid protein [Burkholderiaceae bacterium]|jgi:hypothetical protein|nr:phage major capsid protein [Burkholderiaceae bacterium]